MIVDIRTSQDLLDLLDNNEEFRRAARRALLTDELLELPDIVREMQQTQNLMLQRMDQFAERMDQFAERMDQFDKRMDQFAERMDQFDKRMDQFAERMDRMDARFEQVIAEMKSMNKRIGDIDGRLRGWELERESVAKLLPRLAREYGVVRIRAVGADASRSAVNLNYVWAVRFEEALDAGLDTGRITMEEEGILGRTDIVAWGRRRVDRAKLWFAVQASAAIGNDDIERAAAGAVALEKLTGEDAAAVVYGRRIAPHQRVRADELGVAVMLDVEDVQE